MYIQMVRVTHAVLVHIIDVTSQRLVLLDLSVFGYLVFDDSLSSSAS
jgi:hypothetical protein